MCRSVSDSVSVCLFVSVCPCVYVSVIVCLCVCVGLSLAGDTTDGSGDESDVLYEASCHNTSNNVTRVTLNSSNVTQVTSPTRSQV